MIQNLCLAFLERMLPAGQASDRIPPARGVTVATSSSLHFSALGTSHFILNHTR